jgi:hypothetical protein
LSPVESTANVPSREESPDPEPVPCHFDLGVLQSAWHALENEAELTGHRIDFDRKQLIRDIVVERWKAFLQRKSKQTLGEELSEHRRLLRRTKKRNIGTTAQPADGYDYASPRVCFSNETTMVSTCDGAGLMCPASSSDSDDLNDALPRSGLQTLRRPTVSLKRRLRLVPKL